MRCSSGFTLLELVVVLGILSAMTFLLTTQFSGIRHERCYDRSNAGLARLLSAIAGDRLDAGHPGFVSDMGRLPVAVTNTLDQGELTLAELFVKPRLAVPYGFYPADRHLCRLAKREGVEDSPMDRNVRIAMGWRGPYLSLPPGEGFPFVRDGWGNPMVSRNAKIHASGSSLPDRLLGEERERGVTNGTAIAFIRHFGADGLPSGMGGTDRGFDRDITVAPISNAFATALSGYIQVPTNATTLVVRLYGPPPAPVDLEDAASVMVWEWRRVDSSLTPGQWVPFTLTSSTGRIPVGRRVVRACGYRGENGEIRFTVPHSITLERGENILPFTLLPDQVQP